MYWHTWKFRRQNILFILQSIFILFIFLPIEFFFSFLALIYLDFKWWGFWFLVCLLFSFLVCLLNGVNETTIRIAFKNLPSMWLEQWCNNYQVWKGRKEMYIHKTILSQHLLNCMCVLLDCAMFFWGKARPLLSF